MMRLSDDMEESRQLLSYEVHGDGVNAKTFTSD